MILPTKHIPIDQSLIGLGALILGKLTGARTVTSLWEEVRDYPTLGTFDRFSLTLAMLFSLGAIELRSGQIRRSLP